MNEIRKFTLSFILLLLIIAPISFAAEKITGYFVVEETETKTDPIESSEEKKENISEKSLTNPTGFVVADAMNSEHTTLFTIVKDFFKRILNFFKK